MSNYLSFKDILDTAQAQALADKLLPDEAAIYRYFCRRYSNLFSTELEIVYSLDPLKVAQAVYEHKMDSEDEEEQVDNYLETIYGLEDPEYAVQRARELEEFLENAKEQEIERLRLGKPIHPAMKHEASGSPPPSPEGSTAKPTSGHVDLSYLEKEEQ